MSIVDWIDRVDLIDAGARALVSEGGADGAVTRGDDTMRPLDGYVVLWDGEGVAWERITPQSLAAAVLDATEPLIRAQAHKESFDLAGRYRHTPPPGLAAKPPEWVEGFLAGLEHGYIVEVGG